MSEYGMYGNRQSEFSHLTTESQTSVIEYCHSYAAMMNTAKTLQEEFPMKNIEDMTRDELRAEAKRLDITGRGSMSKSELLAAIQEANELDAFATEVYENLVADTTAPTTPLPETPHRQAKRAKLVEAYSGDPAKRTGERGLVDGQPMTLHYKGRATGAKHYKMLDSLAAAYDTPGARQHFTPATHLPNSERVQKYARQNTCPCHATCGRDIMHGKPKLTHSQMRRVRKNANKHDDSNLYFGLGTRMNSRKQDRAGMSLLARTPEGLGIFYQFSK